jgi:hypothetical protein
MSRGSDPGRGVIILVLGILSIVLCNCLGPVAWVMGAGDLKRIAEGYISREAKGLTQAGMICGIIGTVFLILAVIGAIIWFALFGLYGAAQVPPPQRM